MAEHSRKREKCFWLYMPVSQRYQKLVLLARWTHSAPCISCNMGPGTKVRSKAETRTSTLVGKGIYPIPVAARLSKVSERRIRYWLKGLESENAIEDNRFWQGEHQPIDRKIVLGFLDLQEVRFVEAFLRAGVSWKVLRAAHEVARRRYHTEHPFCTRTFATDGKHIIEELKTSADRIEYEEITKTQKVFACCQTFAIGYPTSFQRGKLFWKKLSGFTTKEGTFQQSHYF
jgi:hypothetical protein